jgi:hypothetical protein
VHRSARHLALLAAATLSVGCGAAHDTAPCTGVTVGGGCWVTHDGLTLSVDRAQRIYDLGRTYWRGNRDLSGWTVAFATGTVVHVDQDAGGADVPHVVDGKSLDGYYCPTHRLILARPLDPDGDCIELSAVFHELGHFWGARDERDPRLFGMWELLEEARDGSTWNRCHPGSR